MPPSPKAAPKPSEAPSQAKIATGHVVTVSTATPNPPIAAEQKPGEAPQKVVGSASPAPQPKAADSETESLRRDMAAKKATIAALTAMNSKLQAAVSQSNRAFNQAQAEVVKLKAEVQRLEKASAPVVAPVQPIADVRKLTFTLDP